MQIEQHQFLVTLYLSRVVKRTDEDGWMDEDEDDGCWVVRDLDTL
jgi:hypothetical protein